uniref:Uncharacterized protein n=1 Tax=Lygus hesperus TaxID=30085 RepID=A0A0K8T1D1_LYGHE
MYSSHILEERWKCHSDQMIYDYCVWGKCDYPSNHTSAPFYNLNLSFSKHFSHETTCPLIRASAVYGADELKGSLKLSSLSVRKGASLTVKERYLDNSLANRLGSSPAF